LKRRVAVAIPAKNEGPRIDACLDRLTAMARDGRVAGLAIVVLANNCTDDTARRVRALAPAGCGLVLREVVFEPGRAHAGAARREAMETAADLLDEPTDLLLSTDADTLVAADWLIRTLDHIDAGYDAVAGLARLKSSEVRSMEPEYRRRLYALGRYEAALNRLRGAGGGEPLPRHFYEGGASIAITLGRYRAIGGAPSPPVAEDKALFEAVRRSGGRVRHPMDVKVLTSARLSGRAPGGAADTLNAWRRQPADAPIEGIEPLNVALGHAHSGAALSFDSLPAEVERARELVRLGRDLSTVAETG
jgi:hypothetical protein